MSDKNYTTIQQHEPLRVPSNWSGQEKKLIVQLEEILDDIYRRFGRLRPEDLAPYFRKSVMESVDGYSSIEQTVEGIRTTVEDANGNASLALQTVNGFERRVSNAEGNASEALQTAQGFEQRVSDAEENASEALQTAQGFEQRVSDAENDASEALQTAKGFEQRVSNAENDASEALQTAQGFEQRVSDAEGNASEALQTANSFSERITDAQGNASEALQTANSFSERITDAQGNASMALQTVNGFENRVEDVEQNSAEAVLRANEAYLKVEAIEGQADYVQYATPTGEIAIGDTWTQVAAPPTTWAEARAKNWSNTKLWGELYFNNVRYFVWDGKQWVPLVDAEEQRRVLTEVQVKADGALIKVEELAGTTPTTVRSTTAAVDLDGFHLYTGGTFDVESGNFNVDKDGNVTIKGYIEAMSGNIGGWVVAENNLHSGSGTNHVRLSTENGKPAIWAGSENADTAPFKVNKDGSMKAESGSIGGWNIAPGNLSSGSGTKHVRLSTEDATYAIWAGAEAGASAPFRVTPDGKVYLTKLYVTDENGNAQENPVNLRTNWWKVDSAYSGNITSAEASTSGNQTTITFFSRGGKESFSVNFKKADGYGYITGLANGNTITIGGYKLNESGQGEIVDSGAITLTLDVANQIVNFSGGDGFKNFTAAKGMDVSALYDSGYGNGYNEGFDDGKDAYQPTSIVRTGYGSDGKSVITKAANSKQDVLTNQTVDATGVYNNGWNECIDNCSYQSDVYRISESQPASPLYMKVGDNYTSVGTGWVRTVRATGIYTIPSKK